jgi:hypothetical protein
VQASAARKDKEENANDLRLPAINVAKAIQCRLSHRQAGRFYAAIALARVARNKEAEVQISGC